MGHKASEVAILVVEDDDLVRALAVNMAGTAGYKVYQAAEADEAIQLLERHLDIRIVFTDVEMPGMMDGIKFAHYVRDRWPPINRHFWNSASYPTRIAFRCLVP